MRRAHGCHVWMQLLPPCLMMALSSACILVLDLLGKSDSPVVDIFLGILLAAVIWLLRIGLSQWQPPRG